MNYTILQKIYYQKEHHNKEKMFDYHQYENWLLHEKNIGTGKPKNGDQKGVVHIHNICYTSPTLCLNLFINK